ncbi:MAG: hypothetical protein JSS75_00955 [Bacteroidetes bacterium]|nr:hypothetical protein [Bacteroidota bacterium]
MNTQLITIHTTQTMKALSIALVLALVGGFTFTANAQNAAPFAGGVKLQQGGGTSPSFGLTFAAKQTYTGNMQLNFVQPTGNGILKVSNWGTNAGDVNVTTLDLASPSDVGTSILSIANGGTGASTANGALNNLLPTQTSNGGKFLTTDGTNASWSTAVTSVGLSLPSIFTVSNSPVTTTGTLTATLANQGGNTVFAAPADGSTGAPSFRNLVASDIPNLDAAKITTGTLPVNRGGTGVTSLTPYGVLTANAAGDGIVSTTLDSGQIMIGSHGGAAVAAKLTAGSGISITNGNGSITISQNNSNFINKKRIALSQTSVSYTGQTPPAGFTLNANSIVTITVMETGGYPITATVSNIDTANNTFDFVISGYVSTATSFALVSFQN